MSIPEDPGRLDVLQFGSTPSVRVRRRRQPEPDGQVTPLRLSLDDDAVPDPHDDPRSARRRKVSMLAVSCVAVAVGGFAFRSAPPPLPDEPDPPPAAAAAAQSGAELVSVRFVDERTGYALASACTAGTAHTCRYVFRVTADGGGSWEYQPVPLNPAVLLREPQPMLTPVGESGVRISGAGQRWYSPNGGRSWDEPSVAAPGAVEQAPPNAPVDVQCRPSCGEFHVTDPATGVRTLLKHQPRLIPLPIPGQAPQPSDGSLWVSGESGADGAPTIAVSGDRGRTWRLSTLPVPAGALGSVLVLTRDGQAAYALVRTIGAAHRGNPDLRGIANGLAGIYRTTDGGRSWRLVPSGGSPGEAGLSQPTSVLAAALTPAGQLVVATEEFGHPNLRFSYDGGRTFHTQPTPGQPQLTTLETAGNRFIGAGLLGGFYTSLDGLVWERIQIDS